MEMEQVKKIIRLDEGPVKNDKEIEVDGGEENDIFDQLPPEILMQILGYLDEKQLVQSRLVNSQWDKFSCLLLQDRSKNDPLSKLIVKVEKPRGKNVLACTTTITKSLDSFLKCFSPSEAEKSSGHRRPFPFSRFEVAGLKCMKQRQMKKFSPLFIHIKTLFLDIKAQDTKNFEKLWKLLLKFANNIQHLGISGQSWLNNLNLFGLDSELNVNVNTKVENQQTESFLQNLKFIQVTTENGFGDFDEFMKKLLENAPNVREVLTRDPEINPWVCGKGFQDVVVLKRLGKSHLLKKLGLNFYDDSLLTEDFAQLMKEVRLEFLHACNMFLRSKEIIFNSMYQAIKSSQNTLSTLHLNNVTTKSVTSFVGDVTLLPNVRHLDIHIRDPVETGNILDRLSQLCPSVTSLKLRLHGDHLDAARNIWTGFKGLKSLKLEVNINITSGNDDSLALALALDSAVSGYSKESIERIQAKLLQEGISLDLDEARREEELQEPSIFDLKDLSRLEIDCTVFKKRSQVSNLKNQLENCLLLKILPQHIRKNPRLFNYKTAEIPDLGFFVYSLSDSSDSDFE